MFPSDEGLQAVGARDVEELVAQLAAQELPPFGGRAKMSTELASLSRAYKTLGAYMGRFAGALASMGGKDHATHVKKELAHVLGTSQAEAAAAIACALAGDQLPEVAEAARSGRLSLAQQAMVTKAALAHPESAQRLLKLAEVASLSQLAKECRQVILATQDPEQRRQSAHINRSVRWWEDEEGWHLRADGTVEDGACISPAIVARAKSKFEAARQAGEHERYEAYLFDALKDAIVNGNSGAVELKAEVIVRVDHNALIRGQVRPGETCEVDGVGTTTPQAVVDLMDLHDPFIKVVLTKGDEVHKVVHLGRRPRSSQMTALSWIYPSCAVAGCTQGTSWLQSDHRDDWAKTHYTVLDLIDRLCPHHHRMKTNHEWGLVVGKGKRPFVSPDNSDHPRYYRGPKPPPPDLSQATGTPPGASGRRRRGAGVAQRA